MVEEGGNLVVKLFGAGTHPAIHLFLLLAAWPGATLRAVEFDGRLPIGKGKLVDPHGDTSSMPSYAGSFLAQYEGDLYVDPLLGTLRYFSPRETIQLFRPGERGELSLVQVATRFIAVNGELFGCNYENLEGPYEFPVDGGNVLLVFRETDGSLPIAGATIRMVVGRSWEDHGVLKSIKGFTLRDPPFRRYDFASFSTVAMALSGIGLHADQAEKQLYFPRHDVSSLTPVWYAQGVNVNGEPLIAFLEARSGEPAELREIASEWRPVSGSVVGLSPDPKDPFATADRYSLENGQPGFFPVPGARVRESSGAASENAVTDRDGKYSLVLGDAGKASLLECSLEYGRCGQDLDGVPGAGDDCPSGGFQVFLRVSRTAGDCYAGPPDAASEVLRQTKSAEASSMVDFVLGPTGEDSVQRFLASLQVMAFHHLRASIEDSLHLVYRNGLAELVGDPRECYPLSVEVSFSAGGDGPFVDPQPGRLEYHPSGADSRICLMPFLEGGQALTPTLILHEAAGHHPISAITGAIQTRHLECRQSGRCIERDDPSGEDPRKVFEGLTLEGFADALAAYQSGVSKFGYYREDVPGPLAYDIAVLDGRISEADRAVTAKALWEVRQGFAKYGASEVARDLLYRYLGRNRTAERRDHLFDPNTLAAELLDILDQPGFTEESDGIPGTISRFDLEMISILDYLFNGSHDDRCLDTMDADGDRELAVTDAIYLIHYQFLGGQPPPPPFPRCNVDPRGSDAIPCRNYPCGP